MFYEYEKITLSKERKKNNSNNEIHTYTFLNIKPTRVFYRLVSICNRVYFYNHSDSENKEL